MARALVKGGAITHPGGRLSEDDLADLITRSLELTMSSLRQALVRNQTAFREVILNETQQNRDLLVQVIECVNGTFGTQLPVLESIDKHLKEINAKVGQILSDNELDIVKRISNIRNEFNRDPFLRVEVQTGIGTPTRINGAIACQSITIDTRTQEFIAVYFFEKYPGALQDNPVVGSYKLEFGNDEESRAKLEEYQKAFSEGHSATIDGKYIKEFKSSLPNLLGEIPENCNIELKIEPSVPEHTPIPVTMELHDKDGQPCGTIPFTQLRVSRAGTQQMTLSTCGSPFEMEISVTENKTTDSISYTIDSAGRLVNELAAFARFVLGLQMADRLTIRNLVDGTRLFIGQIQAPPSSASFVIANFLADLDMISTKLGLQVRLPTLEVGIATQDLRNVQITALVVKQGFIEQSWDSLQFTAPRVDIENIATEVSQGGQFIPVGPIPHTVMLFDGQVSLDLGEFYWHIPCEAFALETIEGLLSTQGDSIEADIRFESPLTVRRVYTRFFDEAITLPAGQ
ncbi:hypothetical protein D3C86_1207700 [compost metagenome]